MLSIPPKVSSHLDELANADLCFAVNAALRAGEVILKYWEDSTVTEFKAKADSHFDLVSFVDETADAAVHQSLNESCPSDKILSEELCPNLSDVQTGRVWIVDPLDGTSSYLFRTDASAPSVMIALLEDGVCQISVICQPIINAWTYAINNVGAFSNGEKVRMRSAEPHLSSAWIDMNHYGGIEFESPTFKKIDSLVRSPLGARLVSRSVPYSAIALRLLDDGQKAGLAACVHDHNPEKPKQLPWDILPVQLIVKEAGGMYVDAVRGLDVPLDPFDLRGPIIVGGSTIVREICSNLSHSSW